MGRTGWGVTRLLARVAALTSEEIASLNDAREAWGAERGAARGAAKDDADFVWHAKADEYRVELSNIKMKDSALTPDIHLRAKPHLESVVLESFTERPSEDQASDRERELLSVLATTFPVTGATTRELLAASGMPESTFHRARNRLLKCGSIVNVGTGSRPRYQLQHSNALPPAGQPSDQGDSSDSNVLPLPGSTPLHSHTPSESPPCQIMYPPFPSA